MPLKTPSYLYFQMKVSLCEQIVGGMIKANAAARTVGKSRQIVHRWLRIYRELGPAGLLGKRPGPKKGSPWNRTPDETEMLVVRLAEDRPFEGPVPLSRAFLEITGETLHPVTVWRILGRRGRRYGTVAPVPRAKPTLYVKGFPGEEVQVDTFYPFGRARKVVLFNAIDDCSRWPESKVFGRRTEANAVAFLRFLVSRAPYRIRAVRTDRGREFGRNFTRACDSLGIEHIRNAGYSPEDNGKVERFNRTLREDLVSPLFHLDATHGELQYLLALFLGHFRHRRPHTGLGMDGLTPAKRLLDHYRNPTSENVNLILQQNKH